MHAPVATRRQLDKIHHHVGIKTQSRQNAKTRCLFHEHMVRLKLAEMPEGKTSRLLKSLSRIPITFFSGLPSGGLYIAEARMRLIIKE